MQWLNEAGREKSRKKSLRNSLKGLANRFVVGNELIEINVDECVDFIASTVN